jgi:signal transduction histidine kinase
MPNSKKKQSLENFISDISDNHPPCPPIEKDNNIRIITLSVIAIVLILMMIYFIKTYVNKKQSVMYNIRSEADILETALSDDMNYSKYFLNLLAKQIINVDYNNIQEIKKIFKMHSYSNEFNQSFGWRKYSFIDVNFLEILTNTKDNITHPKNLSFIQQILPKDNSDKIAFFTSKSSHKNNSLKLIQNLSKNSHRIGSIMLSYDLSTMIRKLNKRKKNEHTNFVILNDKLEIVAQSKPSIHNITIDNHDAVSSYVHDILHKVNFFTKDVTKEISYLNVISGVNYHIKKINDLPFILIINLDSHEIKYKILDDFLKKVTEAGIFTCIFLAIVISIYKRETWLRSKAEEATIIANKATKAKSDFLAFTAHEIRSPLGFILTGSEMMSKELLGELSVNYKKYAEGIHQNAQMILDFITAILDEGQIIEGKFKIVNSITSITDIIEQSVQINKTRFNQRKIDMKVSFEKNLPQLICDQRRILQVMNNLISNAIKYSNDDTVIKIRGFLSEDKMIIEITDQGIGMSSNKIVNILDKSNNLNQKVKHNFIESYGLGLPIVRMLLEAHNASLVINSKIGVGTIVKVIFPKYKLIYTNV